jgi:hypothetical protein
MSKIVDWIDANPWRLAATLSIHTLAIGTLLSWAAIW